jgi:hypothetical protein
LEGKTELVKQSLTLANSQRYGVTLFKMASQENTVPQVLVISQFLRGAKYFTSQLFHIRDRKPPGTSRSVPVSEPSKPKGDEPPKPVFDCPGRKAVKLGSLIGTGPAEDIQNDMEPVEVPRLGASGYLIVNGRYKRLSIRDINSFHWKHLLSDLLPIYTIL